MVFTQSGFMPRRAQPLDSWFCSRSLSLCKHLRLDANELSKQLKWTIARLFPPPGACYSDQIAVSVLILRLFSTSYECAYAIRCLPFFGFLPKGTITPPCPPLSINNNIFQVFSWMIEYLLKFLHIKAGLPEENPFDFLEVLMGNSSVRWIDAARFLEDRGDG